MTGATRATGLLDTSTVILLSRLGDESPLPDVPLISAVTLAELTVGPLVSTSETERSRRQAQLQQVEVDFDPLPFDAAAARALRPRRHLASPCRPQDLGARLRRPHRRHRDRQPTAAVHG